MEVEGLKPRSEPAESTPCGQHADPSPDVRELAIRTIVAIIDEKAKQRRAGWTTSARRAATEYADAVLAAVSPVIRRQERAKIADEVREMVKLRERAARATARDYPNDATQQNFSNGQIAAYCELDERLARHFAAAIARTHAHPEEGK